MGYSLGGGGALGVSAHPKVIATIAMHPAPGFGAAHGPVLLFTGTNDVVCARVASALGLQRPGRQELLLRHDLPALHGSLVQNHERRVEVVTYLNRTI